MQIERERKVDQWNVPIAIGTTLEIRPDSYRDEH